MNCNFNVRNVQLVDHIGSDANIPGTIYVTTSHFVFKADESGKEIWVVNNLVGNIERTPQSTAGSRLTIKCKHFLVLVFHILKDRDCQSLFESLQRIGKAEITNLPAFKTNSLDSQTIWQRLDWNKEFIRQGVTNYWTESKFNSKYSYCDTYPEALWFPHDASLQLLIGSCNFRSKARLPALTYFYKPNSASICRCAQPLAGFSARCIEDEALMELIMNANQTSSPLYLVDTRPRVNAMVNKVQGKGFEDIRNYTNMQFHFFDIENIHVMRGSLAKLLEACQKPQTMTHYLKAIDSSGWLRHLRSLVECGKFIAESVQRGISCVVHCSDGWDRTSQTVSIAQLILDPYYRTIEGFEVLIDKDWLGFGHKFSDRCSYLGNNSDESSKEVAPIFTQFLDVVYQIMRKNPTAFEFNERFLIILNEHAYSLLFGNFVGNCDKDRKDLRLCGRTPSLWAYIDLQKDDFMNPFYEKSILLPDDIETKPSSFVVWTAMYNRFDTGIHPREYLFDIAQNTKLHVDFLRELMDGDLLKNHSQIEIRWQSLLAAEECSTQSCRREFDSRFDRRLHCLSCGKIFCRRCFSINNSFERVCKNCSSLRF